MQHSELQLDDHLQIQSTPELARLQVCKWRADSTLHGEPTLDSAWRGDSRPWLANVSPARKLGPAAMPGSHGPFGG
eukprot:365469-Chlamydomonas_euryale.AAC.30